MLPWTCILIDLSAPTQVISLENTLNGFIFPQEEIIKISEFARKAGIRMHLDGARLWHVAAETGTSMRELCNQFDSVSLCFSKGLGTSDRRFEGCTIHEPYQGAPVGSCLAGTRDFISRARWYRKLFGGGMRQIGLLAGCVTYALNHNFPQLPRVHALTRRLEAGLRDLGVHILGAGTCMVCQLFPVWDSLRMRFRSSMTPHPWASSITSFLNARQCTQNQ